MQVPQSQPQNVAQGQLSATNTQAIQQSPVAPQQQSPLLQPPVPSSHAAPKQQGQPQFVQPRVSPQGQPVRQQRQPSPFRQGFNPSAQPFVPGAEAQPNAVPNTPENKVPKSNGGQGVKSSAPNGRMCFRCKQPRHLKKDCPELPYCSRCHTRGHIPAKCPTKNQGDQKQDEKHKKGGQQMDKRCENWKQAQDQPQFSNPNGCLHCAGDHRSRNCPTRHQHQAPTTNNPVGSTGINSQHSPYFSQPSPPQHSQQSQSMAGSSTPMLMINNPLQFQQGHRRQITPPVQQQANQQVSPPVSQQFNPQFNQYTPPHASPLLSQPQFNPQCPPPYPGQWPQHPSSVHSNITETSKLIMQVLDRQFKLYQDREDAHEKCERWREEREKKFRDDNNNRNRINKAFEKIN